MKKGIKTIFKSVFWTLFGCALVIFGLLVGATLLLTPPRLTPLVQELATKSLDADVEIARAGLSLRKSFPFINLRIDSLTILSKPMLSLEKSRKDSLPVWADTLISIHAFTGGLNLASLMVGKIALNEVQIVHPRINVLEVNDELSNYMIWKSSADDSSEPVDVPDISINRFSIVSPASIRFLSIADSLSAQVNIQNAWLINHKDGKYNLDINTNFSTPLLDKMGPGPWTFSLDGNIGWNHKKPFEIMLEGMSFDFVQLKGVLNSRMNFEQGLVLEALDLKLNPIPIQEAVALFPAEMVKDLKIPSNFKTDAQLGLGLMLNAPYDFAASDLPYCKLDVNVPNCAIKWGKTHLQDFAIDASVALCGNNLDSSSVEVKNLVMQGPATRLQISGFLSDMLTDPFVMGKIHGNTDLALLPAPLASLLGDCSLKGKVTLDTELEGRRSMLTSNNFHKLYLKGNIKIKDFCYLASDTVHMYYAKNALAKFGTSESYSATRISRRDSASRTFKYDSLLAGSITVDSVRMITSGMAMRIADFKLGVGALNTARSADTTDIIPFGGVLSASMFSIFSLTDTAGVRIRDFNGKLSLRRYKGDKHLPLLILDAGLGRISAGNNSTRMMISEASLKARINKQPDSLLSASRARLRHIADSVKRAQPNIPIDSVYILAEQIQRRKRTGHRRVHLLTDTEDNELLDWGTSNGIKRLLLDFNLKGTLKAKEGRLFTSSFPVRNVVKGIDLHFNNDSIILNDLIYKAGHSDFLVSGTISNMKRALTSTRKNQPIKVDFSLLSDTIDVNQLAQAFFTGAANKDKKLAGTIAEDSDVSAIEKSQVKEKSDSVGPFLIPVNIEAELDILAKNVIYSDFMLKDLSGTVLAYDGALNLRNLSAWSDVGSLDFSALYSAPAVRDMKFGMSLNLNKFNIRQFLQLVPAIDSIMPLMRDMGGIIDAKIAATADVDPQMNLVLPTLDAAINLQGDSLVVLDPATFRTMAKWLMFKNKNRNMINHMAVDMIIENNRLQLYPFIFDFDRYRLGVQGSNDLELNYDYHIAVLKSPLPFKFGINIKGNMDDFKIRLGKARFNEKQVVRDVALTDTARVNLIKQFENVFRRGVRNSRFAKLDIASKPIASEINLNADTLSRSDSLYLIQEGLIPDPSHKHINEQ